MIDTYNKDTYHKAKLLQEMQGLGFPIVVYANILSRPSSPIPAHPETKTLQPD